jgi:transketolase
MYHIFKGNDIEAIIAGMTDAKSRTGKGKPVCVLLHTEMGNGVDFMMLMLGMVKHQMAQLETALLKIQKP